MSSTSWALPVSGVQVTVRRVHVDRFELSINRYMVVDDVLHVSDWGSEGSAWHAAFHWLSRYEMLQYSESRR